MDDLTRQLIDDELAEIASDINALKARQRASPFPDEQVAQEILRLQRRRSELQRKLQKDK